MESPSIPRVVDFMFTIPGKTGRCCDGISRRAFMQIGGLGFGGLTLPQLLRAEKQASLRKRELGAAFAARRMRRWRGLRGAT